MSSFEVFKCCICYDNPQSGKKNDVTQCGHIFHKECLKLALTHKNRNARRCPACQQKVTSTGRVFFTCTEEVVDQGENLEEAKQTITSQKAQIRDLQAELQEAKQTISIQESVIRELQDEKQMENIQMVKNLLEEMVTRGETARDSELAFHAFAEFSDLCEEICPKEMKSWQDTRPTGILGDFFRLCTQTIN